MMFIAVGAHEARDPAEARRLFFLDCGGVQHRRAFFELEKPISL
jgi:hypothetical protein